MGWQELSVLTVSAEIYDGDAGVKQQYLRCAFYSGKELKPPATVRVHILSKYPTNTRYKVLHIHETGLRS